MSANDPLGSLLARADLVAPIEHQRRIAAVLDDLIDEGASPTVDTEVGPLPVLDLFRTEIIVYAARIALWQDLLMVLPRDVMLRVPVSPELTEADHLVRRAGHVPALLFTPSSAIRHDARRLAYRASGPARRAVGARRAARGAPPPGHVAFDAVFVPWRSGHVVRWRPVLERLTDEDGWSTLVLATDQRTIDLAASTGMATQAVRWGGGRADARRVRRELGHLSARTGGPLGAAVREMPAAALGSVRAMIGAVAALDRPRVLLVANPYIAEGRGAALAARGRGIPVVSAQHGTIFPDDPRWARCPVDRFGVWGPAAVEALVESGMTAQQLFVTGARVGTEDDPAPDGRASEGMPGSTVLVATSGAGDRVSLAQHLVFLDWLGRAIQATPELQWRVKLHPKDDPALYAGRAFAGAEVVRAGSDTPPIERFLREADVLVTVASASALDAARLGVPVVLVAVPGSDDHERVPLLAGVADGVAAGGEQLAAEVRRLVASPPTHHETTLDSWVEPVDDAIGAFCAEVRRVSR